MGGLLAYLDPGSGSLILQAIVGGAAAAAVMGKIYWRRFLGFLRIRKKDDR
jgi:fucose permease